MAKKTETRELFATLPAARTLWLASLGFYGRLYDEALKRAEQPRERAQTLISGFVAKGEEVEKETRSTLTRAQKEATDNLKAARTQVQTTVEERIAKLRDALPVPQLPANVFPANARIKELEAEVDALTRKVNALNAKKAAAKTAAKPAAPKAAAKPRTAKKAA